MNGLLIGGIIIGLISLLGLMMISNLFDIMKTIVLDKKDEIIGDLTIKLKDCERELASVKVDNENLHTANVIMKSSKNN